MKAKKMETMKGIKRLQVQKENLAKRQKQAKADYDKVCNTAQLCWTNSLPFLCIPSRCWFFSVTHVDDELVVLVAALLSRFKLLMHCRLTFKTRMPVLTK